MQAAQSATSADPLTIRLRAWKWRWAPPASFRDVKAMLGRESLAFVGCSNLRAMLGRLRRPAPTARSLAMLVAHVFADGRHQFKVLQPVIVPDLVDVVDDRTLGDRAVGARPHQTMLENE